MKTRYSTLFFIIVVTLIALIFALPERIPLKFSLGPFQIDRVTKSPHKRIETHLGLDLSGGTQVVLEADMSQVATGERKDALESIREIIERRINFYGVSEPIIQTAIVGQNHRVTVELPGVKDVTAAIETIGQTAQLEFREFKEGADATGSAFFAYLADTQSTGITGKDLKKAALDFDPNSGKPIVAFEMTEEGAKKFAEVSTRLVGKRLAIFLDDTYLSAPIVRVPITNGKGSITDINDLNEAKKLALQLNSGALPTSISIIEQKNIGATLGQTSITKSIRGGIIGLILVALFMLVQYRVMGIIAILGLCIYGVITFAIFRTIPITLTLPGIAGFILSIGMAVDSNILIFERMKEESRKGSPWQLAMELGFGKAWDSIKDANFTTILTCLILYNPLNWDFLPVSGTVRGFALTLLIGVVVGLFTGIFVTRNLMRTLYKSKQ